MALYNESQLIAFARTVLSNPIKNASGELDVFDTHIDRFNNEVTRGVIEHEPGETVLHRVYGTDTVYKVKVGKAHLGTGGTCTYDLRANLNGVKHRFYNIKSCSIVHENDTVPDGVRVI